MYDYEFVMPTEVNNEVIVQRIKDFKKYGFMNHEGLKIKLFLMASKDNDPKILQEGWPSNFDIEVVVTPFTHVAQRIYWYYARYLKPDRARWYVRIDEDSLTDMGGLENNLNLMFDDKLPYHVVGKLNWDVWEADEEILRSLGYGHFYRHHSNHHDFPPHEHEISVTSNVAIKMLCNNPSAKKYFEVRKEFPDGYGDHGLCHCLRMSKVYPIVVSFLTHEPELINFSAFGGFRNHIHHTCRDMTPKIMEWLDNHNTNYHVEDNCTFLIGRKNEQKRWVRFNKEKTVTLMRHGHWGEIIALWFSPNDEVISFYTDNQHEPIFNFKKRDENLYAYEDFELIKINIGN